MPLRPYIVTLTGPSCAGKTTLEGHLKNAGFASIISTTTRAPRIGEVNSKNYHFITPAQFEEDLNKGLFVESVEFGGNRYGASVAEVEKAANSKMPVVIVVEPIGASQIWDFCQNRNWNITAVFINNAPEVIAKRFLTRMRDDLLGVKDQHSVLTRYAERMGTMMTTEREWVRRAGRTDGYDIILSEFGPEDIEPAVLTLVGLANSKGYFGDHW